MDGLEVTDRNATSKARLRLWLKLLRTSRETEAVLRERLRSEFATTLPRFDVLAGLSRYPDGIRMSGLSKVLRVSNGNVTGIVDRLVSDGLVSRTPVESDRRAFRVALTPAGEAAFAEQADAHEAWVNELLDGIDERDAAEIAAGLDQSALLSATREKSE